MSPARGVRDGERLQTLYELGVAFVSRTDVQALVREVIARCREVLVADGAAVLLVDPETGDLSFPFTAQAEAGMAERLATMRVPAGRGIAGRVLASGKPELVRDVSADRDFYGRIDEKTNFRTRDMIIAPLLRPAGPIGVIEVVNRRSGSFTTEDLAFLAALATSIGVAIENAKLYDRLRREEEHLRDQVGALRRDLVRHDPFGEIVGSGPAMQDVFRLMESAASSPISVLIEGATGTGKELVARGIHRASERGRESFLAVNCAALPETLLESELFGHRKGAFTGATTDRRGLFEVAAGGSVFLDEIGEMPVPMQVKLLRVLQESEVIPLGDSRPRKVDVRVISATNRDLQREVEAGRFRDDLYFRIAAFPLRLPPLRERREDIPALALHFLQASATRHHKRVEAIDPIALEYLSAFDWPGNARELQNEIERAVAVCGASGRILPEHLSAKVSRLEPSSRPAFPVEVAGDRTRPGDGGFAEREGTRRIARESLRHARDAFEAGYIQRVLEAEGGNVSRAAQTLGLSRAMLHKKLRRMQIERPRSGRGNRGTRWTGGVS